MPTKDPYMKEYQGYWTMYYHDIAEDMKRWMGNYVCNHRDVPYIASTEWITIEKTVFEYIGTIGADHLPENNWRKVKFEPTAPPPPSFYIPAKEKYKPPEPPDPTSLDKWNLRMARDRVADKYEMSVRELARIRSPDGSDWNIIRGNARVFAYGPFDGPYAQRDYDRKAPPPPPTIRRNR